MALYVAMGNYVGTGAGRSITGLGFQPKVVLVKQLSFEPGVIATDTMPTGESKIAGTAAFVTNRITSLDSDGFTLGTDADAVESNLGFEWIAFGGSECVTGTYTGNATSSQSITGMAAQPELVFTMSPSRSELPFVSPLMVPTDLGGGSSPGSTTFVVTSDGFTVGNHNSVNTNGATYHYFALLPDSDALSVIEWAGTGSAGNKTGFGFDPHAVVIKRQGSLTGAVWKTRASSPTAVSNSVWAASFTGTTDITNLITDGVTVGTTTAVNASGSDYLAIGFRHNTPLSANGTGPTRLGEISPTHNASAGTTLSLTVPSGGIPVDSTLFIIAGLDANTASSVTDTRGNTYANEASETSDRRAYIFRSRLATALQAGDTITLTASANTTMVLRALWYSGIADAAPVVTAGASVNNAEFALSAQPTGANQLVIGAIFSSGNATITAGYDNDGVDGLWDHETPYNPNYANSVNLYSILHSKVVGTGTPSQRYNPWFDQTIITGTGIMAIYAAEGEVSSLTRDVPASAALQATLTRSVPASAALTLSVEREVPASAALQATRTRSVPASAALTLNLEREVPASAALQATHARSVAASAALQSALSREVPASAAFSAVETRSVPASAAISGGATRNIPASAALQATESRSVPASAALRSTLTRSVAASVALSSQQAVAVPASAAFSGVETRTVPASVAVSAVEERSVAASAALQTTLARSVPASAALTLALTRSAPTSVALQATETRSVPTSAALRLSGDVTPGAVNYEGYNGADFSTYTLSDGASASTYSLTERKGIA